MKGRVDLPHQAYLLVFAVGLAISITLWLGAGTGQAVVYQQESPVDSPLETPTPTPSGTPTPSPQDTDTPTPSATVAATESPTPTGAPTGTETPVPSLTTTSTPTLEVAPASEEPTAEEPTPKEEGERGQLTGPDDPVPTATATRVVLFAFPPTERPITEPEPTPPPDVLAGVGNAIAAWLGTGAWLWFTCGSLVFFIVAGIIAGVNFYQQERHRYELFELFPDEEPFEDPGSHRSRTGRAERSAAEQDDVWPASLP